MNRGAINIVERFWSLMASNDFAAVGAVLGDDFELFWPQSGELIRGRDNFAAMNAEYPAHGPWTFTINRLFGDEHEVVSDVLVTDGAQKARALSFFTINDGLIVGITEFWPEAYAAPTNRRHLVASVTPA